MDVQHVGTEWELDEPIVPREVIESYPAAENNSKRGGAYVFISVTLVFVHNIIPSFSTFL